MYVVTTNATITLKGKLVMGRGAAEQATKRLKGIQKEAADVIKFHAWINRLSKPPLYGFLPVRLPRPEEGKYGFGIFQVKSHYSNKADLDIISTSASGLRVWALENSEVTIRMNYPGIGNGRLDKSSVIALIRGLPDNVYIYHY